MLVLEKDRLMAISRATSPASALGAGRGAGAPGAARARAASSAASRATSPGSARRAAGGRDIELFQSSPALVSYSNNPWFTFRVRGC